MTRPICLAERPSSSASVRNLLISVVVHQRRLINLSLLNSEDSDLEIADEEGLDEATNE